MPAIEEFESIISEARNSGQLGLEQTEFLRSFFADMEHNAFALYEAAILVSSRMYNREKIAQFWKEQGAWFEAQLAIANRTQHRLANVQPPSLDLNSIITALEEIVDACSEHYEFHA